LRPFTAVVNSLNLYASPIPRRQSLSAAPPPTSCRAGAVVHLLRANGIKVPVTLSIAQHDDGERVQHIVKVFPSNEAARLDSQRLVLTVGESGTVLAVNAGASRALFGFLPQTLVGQRLSSFINVFREYARAHGSDDTGLLTALGVRALEGAADDAWRVGITAPGASEKVRGALGSAGLRLKVQNTAMPAYRGFGPRLRSRMVQWELGDLTVSHASSPAGRSSIGGGILACTGHAATQPRAACPDECCGSQR
jgi:hypothetical protein